MESPPTTVQQFQTHISTDVCHCRSKQLGLLVIVLISNYESMETQIVGIYLSVFLRKERTKAIKQHPFT